MTSGSHDCPAPELCDVTPDGIRAPSEGPDYVAYVHRHCLEHNLGTFKSLADAERNLGVWCFYFFHKYVWGNPTLAVQPHWEIHQFIANSVWNQDDLETNTPMESRSFRLPALADRKPGEYKRMKQVEVPRECQKTSIGARAYSVFRACNEYFIHDRGNYRRIIRSATGKNTRDTLSIIRRMSTRQPKIANLYGIWAVKCSACGVSAHSATRRTTCGTCASERVRAKRISLINDSRNAGGFGDDMVSFRWLTDAAAKDVDAVAAYSIWVAGLETEAVGQRPDGYTWDDPQTDKNSDTPEKRAKIHERFDDSVRQLEFDGELLVFDTRKYVDDFAGKITKEPLSTLFHTLHRPAYWDNATTGQRTHYYPVKGDGKPALNADALAKYEMQMVERRFSAEYLNNPLDPARALFRREHFKIIARKDTPPEIRYGLGANVSPGEEYEMRNMGLRVVAYNGCDPAAKSEQSRRGDDTFIVGLRVDRYGAIYVTRLQAGKWSASRTWDEIAAANAYNRPEFTDYELPADDKHVRPSFEKWVRERSEALSAPVIIPMKWQSMPKSGKFRRIEAMEVWTKSGQFFILDDAADPALIERYIGQWIGYGVSDHDDGPDATSRLYRWLIMNTYQQPSKPADEPAVTVADGVASVPVALIHELANTPAESTELWGQRGW